MRVCVAQHLARRFGRRVRADGFEYGIVFREWNFLVLAVDRRRRAEDELTDVVLAREFEKVERAVDVRLCVEHRLCERRAHAGARGEVNDEVEARLGENPFERGAVAYVRLEET